MKLETLILRSGTPRLARQSALRTDAIPQIAVKNITLSVHRHITLHVYHEQFIKDLMNRNDVLDYLSAFSISQRQ